jgi:hypothetical protein
MGKEGKNGAKGGFTRARRRCDRRGRTGLGGGVASAADDTSIWLVPGVEGGSLLRLTVGLPAGARAPIEGSLTYLAG